MTDTASPFFTPRELRMFERIRRQDPKRVRLMFHLALGVAALAFAFACVMTYRVWDTLRSLAASSGLTTAQVDLLAGSFGRALSSNAADLIRLQWLFEANVLKLFVLASFILALWAASRSWRLRHRVALHVQPAATESTGEGTAAV